MAQGSAAQLRVLTALVCVSATSNPKCARWLKNEKIAQPSRLSGEDEPLVKRRELLEKHVLPTLDKPIPYSPVLQASLVDLIRSVKAQGFEGLVGKNRNSYEPCQRSGAWQEMRVNQGKNS